MLMSWSSDRTQWEKLARLGDFFFQTMNHSLILWNHTDPDWVTPTLNQCSSKVMKSSQGHEEGDLKSCQSPRGDYGHCCKNRSLTPPWVMKQTASGTWGQWVTCSFVECIRVSCLRSGQRTMVIKVLMSAQAGETEARTMFPSLP